MKHLHSLRPWIVALALPFALSPLEAAAQSGERLATPHPDTRLEAIRTATARFADVEQARAEGWNVEATPCMTSALGGQGYHMVRPELMGDAATLDPFRPELLMYEPQADGSLRFIAVEYAIPVADWTGQAPPTLLGREFHVNEKFGLWVLHVWWVPNARGMHADWNPAITCDHAG